MPRSVNHVASKARRRNYLKLAKGYYGRRKNVWTVAKNTIDKGLLYAYRDRRNKFMHLIHTNNVQLSRKTLAELALNSPDAFNAVVSAVR